MREQGEANSGSVNGQLPLLTIWAQLHWGSLGVHAEFTPELSLLKVKDPGLIFYQFDTLFVEDCKGRHEL